MGKIMNELDILVRILIAVITAWFGLLEYRMRKLNDKVEKTYTKSETKEMIDIKQEALKEKMDNIKESQDDIKKDIHDIKDSLTKIVSRPDN